MGKCIDKGGTSGALVSDLSKTFDCLVSQISNHELKFPKGID